MEGAFRRISRPTMSGFLCALSFFVLAIYPSTSVLSTFREMEGGRCVAVAVALSFFHSEGGGCFRGLQKCARKRFDGAVEFAKNGRLEKVDLGSWIVDWIVDYVHDRLLL